MTGRIKHLDKAKGFGFIKGENGTEYFFHRSNLKDMFAFEMLEQDQPVEFEEQLGSAKGPRAERVQVT